MKKKHQIIYQFDDELQAVHFFNAVHYLITTGYFGKISPTVETKGLMK
jgi:hypothetical protein